MIPGIVYNVYLENTTKLSKKKESKLGHLVVATSYHRGSTIVWIVPR